MILLVTVPLEVSRACCKHMFTLLKVAAVVVVVAATAAVAVAVAVAVL